MKAAYFYLVSILMILGLGLNAQESIQGKVLNTETKAPIAYVNIGVIGKNIGTVSAENGDFQLSLVGTNQTDTIKFSSIGYAALEMQIGSFLSDFQESETIAMQPLSFDLGEVEVIEFTDKKIKVLGNKAEENFVSVTFDTLLLGNEFGLIIKNKNKPTKLLDFNAFVNENTCGLVKVRMNVYKVDKNKIGERVSSQNVFLETNQETGKLRVDLKDYNIIVEGDFALTLELIETLNDCELLFAGRLFGPTIIVRYTSQGNWFTHKGPFGSLGFNVRVRQ